jgi:hypothetical protein
MSLAVLVLFLASCAYIVSSAFIDFQLTIEDPNHLTLECYSSETGGVDSGAVISFFSSPSPTVQPHMHVRSGATFNITPENEAFLRCNSSDGRSQSPFVAIAGEREFGGSKM